MKRFIFVAVLFLAVASVAAAGTTGKLSGIVADDQGQPVPGATVSISSPTQIGGVQTTATEADGSFSFPGLAPGEYSVKIELLGFVAQERTEVQVRLDRTTELRVTMPAGTFGEEVTVVAETPVVDPTQVSTSQTFTADYLAKAAVGAANRGYQSVLTQAAGVVGGANPNVFGSTESENAYFVDGMDTTDPVTATFGTNFNFDAIQEISFQTGGFEAEYGRATGGVVNLITKSGGNTFSGTLDVRYRETSFYQDGDHYDPNESPMKFVQPAVTLGGPVLRDRIWFFASYEDIDSQQTPSQAPSTFKYKGQDYLGKLTWQLNPNWRLIAKVSGDPADIDNSDASRYVEEEANQFQTQGGNIYQGELSGVLSSNLLFGFAIGFNRGFLDNYPQSGDFETVGHYSYDTGIYSVNGSNMEYSDRNRDEYKASLTYFLEGFGGSHELKGGVEYSKLDFWSHHWTTGEYFYRDIAYDPESGDFSSFPYSLWSYPDDGPVTYAGNLQTFFLQDAWKPRPNFTVKLGARWDQVKYDNDLGVEVANLDMLQPRLGIAWDVVGDAKNLAKLSWGRFMAPNALQLPGFARSASSPSQAWLSCSLYFGSTEACQAFVDSRADRGYLWQAGPDDWDPSGWFLNPANTFGSAPNQIAADLSATYADELIVGYEREIGRRTSIEITFIDKKTRDIFEDTCDGNLPTPSEDASCDYYVMANLPELKRDYQGWMVSFESRPTNKLWLLASYTYSKSQGSVENRWNAAADFDIYPYHFVNMYGYLGDDRRHRVKLNGYLILPYDFIIGVDAFWSSAWAWAPTEDLASPLYGQQFLEPRGSRRGNDNYQIDLQVSKGFRLGPTNIQLIGTIYNLLSSEQVTGRCTRSEGCGTDSDTGLEILTGDPTTWQTPLRYELGFRIEF